MGPGKVHNRGVGGSGELPKLNEKSGKGGPSAAALSPGNGGTPPGQGGIPPGLAKKMSDVFTPQNAPQPVEINPRPTGERPAPQDPAQPPRPDGAGAPPVIGRLGPEGRTVPFINQYAPTGAAAGYDGTMNCGPAAAAMMARSVGYEPQLNDAELVNKLAAVGGTDPTKGTTGNGMIAMFEEMGLQTAASEGADLAWIQNQVQSGKFVTALGDFYEVPGRENSNLSAGHYLTIIGMDRQTGDFQVMDSASSQVQSLTAAQLSNFINSLPEGGFAISAGK